LFFFCFFLFLLFHKACEAAKSGLVLFHEAMGKFENGGLEESFGRFEKLQRKEERRIHAYGLF
jgi:hypothetical protein